MAVKGRACPALSTTLRPPQRPKPRGVLLTGIGIPAGSVWICSFTRSAVHCYELHRRKKRGLVEECRKRWAKLSDQRRK
jgi:hypothetical protein